MRTNVKKNLALIMEHASTTWVLMNVTVHLVGMVMIVRKVSYAK